MSAPFCPMLNRYCLGSACVRFVPELTTNVDGKTAAWRIGVTEPGGGVLNQYDVRVFGKNTGRGWCADNLRGVPFKDPNPATEK